MQKSNNTIVGWQAFIDSLATLPERMLATLSPEQQADPQIQQEVARLALESLAASTIGALGNNTQAPQFLPAIGQLLNVGQPNADTVYRACLIDPKGRYRLRGRQGSLALAVISQVIVNTNERPHLNLADLKTDHQGDFDVLLSSEKPTGYNGDWWSLNPAAVQLMVRFVSTDWGREAEPTLSIERVDLPVQNPRTPAHILEQRLQQLPKTVDRMALMFVDHFAQLRDEGYINTLKVLDLEYGALADQFYYEGTFELGEDDALVIESAIPNRCDYRSLILTNEVYETIDWYNNHSSLNGSQAAPDADGKLRIVVSAKDPGIRNWLDTAGHARGIIQGRWTGCDSHPIPTVHKLKLHELDTFLPGKSERITPEQRQAIIRERRCALQQRSLW